MSPLSRRRFLSLAGSASVALLTGCTLDPSSRLWGAFTWAEGLNHAALGLSPIGRAPAREYPASAISSDFPVRSLNLPASYATSLSDWTLEVGGRVARPLTFTLDELKRKFARVSSTTRHDCVEGWSAIACWTGLRLGDLLAEVRPRPEVRYVVCHAADLDDDGTPFYGSIGIQDAYHPQVLLAYEMNGSPLSVDHGAPLRLKIPTQLGYKSTKYIRRIELVDSLAGIGQGHGGYWEDQGYEWYAGV